MIADSGYSKNRIEKYVSSRWEKHYGRQDSIFPGQWEKAYRQLSMNDLIRNDEEHIEVEEAYLDKFFPESKDLGHSGIKKDLQDWEKRVDQVFK